MFSPNAIKVLEKRYLTKDENGNIKENPEDLCWRVASFIAEAEKSFPNSPHHSDPSGLAQCFFDAIYNKIFIPNSPTLMNAGKPLGQLSACFVLPVEDSMEGIFDSVKHAAIIHKTGGGCIAGKSLIYTTTHGIETIEKLYWRYKNLGVPEVRQDERSLCMNVSSYNIFTLSMNPKTLRMEEKQLTHLWSWDVAKENQIRVSTSSGSSIITSSWHPFLSLSTSGNVVETQAQHLTSGSIIFQPYIQNIRAHLKKFSQKDMDAAWLTDLISDDELQGETQMSHPHRIKDLQTIILPKRGNRDRIALNFQVLEPFLTKAGVDTNTTYIHHKAVRVYGKLFWLAPFKEGKGIGRSKLIDLCESLIPHVTNQEAEFLNCLKQAALCGICVTSIQSNMHKEPFYDFTVEGNNNYFAGENGFLLVHNTGFNFSRLRPANDSVKSTCGVSSGPVSFMKVFNIATETIKQGGTRRGANMAVLRIDHPNILEFITCKRDQKELTNFNISVAVTNNFMEAVLKDSDYALINPRTKQESGRLSAKTVFDILVKNAWANGEPGLLFIDEINKYNPTPQLGEIESTNPCVSGETWIQTERGPQQVKDVVGRPVSLMLEGKLTRSHSSGFFSTGKNPLLRIETKEGYSLLVTPEHKMIRKEGKHTDVEALAKDLCVKDRLPLDLSPDLTWKGNGKTEAEGYLVGLYLGDGFSYDGKAELSLHLKSDGPNTEGELFVQKKAIAAINSLENTPEVTRTSPSMTGEVRMTFANFRKLLSDLNMPLTSKMISEECEKSSSSFYCGFLQGLFDTKGTVERLNNSRVSIRLPQSDLSVLKAAQRMLLRLGIFSFITKNKYKNSEKTPPDEKKWQKSYSVKPNHALIITGSNLKTFEKRIGFTDSLKKENLAQITREIKFKKTATIIRVSSISPANEEETYDIQVPGLNKFSANGIIVHNCGELPALPYESCNLGSINVSKFVTDKNIDWQALKKHIHLAIRFLDNVIEVNKFPLPQIEALTKANRKIGLGIMGWADLLVKMGIPYASHRAVFLAEEVMSFFQNACWNTSRELAEERGAFKNWETSTLKERFLHPVRNATTTTIAPTGTISIIADCSSGIEPHFGICFEKHVMNNEVLVEINSDFLAVAKSLGFYSEDLMKRISKSGSIQGFSEIPQNVRDIFLISHDIAPEWHVRMQAAFQKYTDNAVSKTINFPHAATCEQVREVYLMAYQTHCKGITVYRDGSRDGQVLNIGDKKIEEKKSKQSSRNRPDITTGTTERVKIGCGNLYVTVNSDDRGVCEVFTSLGRAGGCPSQSEATARLVSMALRAGLSVEDITEQLKGIRCLSTLKRSGENGTRILSCPDAIGKAIEKFHKSGVKKDSLKLPSAPDPKKETCPDCSKPLEHTGGCVICPFCGYSKCG